MIITLGACNPGDKGSADGGASSASAGTSATANQSESVISIPMQTHSYLMYPSGFNDSSNNTNNDSVKTHFVIDGKVLATPMDGTMAKAWPADDGALQMIMSNDNNDLYQLKGDSFDRIASDVTMVQIAPDNDTFCYVSDQTLYVRKLSGTESTRVADIKINLKNVDVEFSPDGKTLLYNDQSINDASEQTLWLYDGTLTKIGDNLIGMAVSNGGSDIYYYDKGQQALYHTSMNADKRTELVAGGDLNGAAGLTMINKDHTQLLYTIYSGTGTNYDSSVYITYFLNNDNEKVKLDGLNGSPHIPNTPFQSIEDPDKLTNQLYSVNNGGVYYFDDKFHIKKIAADTQGVQLAQNGKTLVYQRNNNLYRMDDWRKANAEQIASGISSTTFRASWMMTTDGSTVYYINSDKELYVVRGTAESEKIADNVNSMNLSHDNILFYITDMNENFGLGSLYACTSASDKERIADDVYIGLDAEVNTTIYLQAEDPTQTDFAKMKCDVYSAASGKNFEVIIKSVDLPDYRY